MSLDQAKLEAFAGQVVSDMAAAASGMMTNLGHKLGLIKAMAGAGPLTASQLSGRTSTRALRPSNGSTTRSRAPTSTTIRKPGPTR